MVTSKERKNALLAISCWPLAKNSLTNSQQPIANSLLIISIVLICILSRLGFTQHDNIQFEHLSIEDGLSQSSVFCMLQDREGFMWFGTANGLNKYDGYTFQVYTHNPDDPQSIANDWINALHEDSDGDLWIGTSEGLSVLPKDGSATGSFRNYKRRARDSESLSNNYVRALLADDAGRIWAGTPSGLSAFDKQTQKFTRFTTRNGLKGSDISTLAKDQHGNLIIAALSGGLNLLTWSAGKSPEIKSLNGDITAISIFEDRSKNLWFGTSNDGIYKVDSQTKAISHFKRLSDHQQNTIVGNRVTDILQDRSGALWIATSDGISKLNMTTGIFENFRYDPLNPNSIRSNNMTSLVEDQSGILWFGSILGGIDRASPRKNKIRKFTYNPYKPDGFKSKRVYSFGEDNRGLIWIGSWFDLAIYDRRNGRFALLSDKQAPLHPEQTNIVTCILNDSNGSLWVGSKSSGLFEFDIEKFSPEMFFDSTDLRLADLPSTQRKDMIKNHYFHQSGNPYSLSSSASRVIYEDSRGDLWIGTQRGLNRLNRNAAHPAETRQRFSRFYADDRDSNSLSNNQITAILEDHQGDIWVGTQYGGLNRLSIANADSADDPSYTFTRYFYSSTDSATLSHNAICAIYEDDAGIIWVSTYGGGLNKFDRERASFKRYTDKNGLPNNVVYGILPDDDGNLWLSTNQGISKFDPVTEQFKNYDVHEGLQSNEFNTGAYFRSNESGDMFFGGINGFNVFHPDSLQDNPHVPAVLITNINVFNRSIFDREAGEPELGRQFRDSGGIELPHDRNFLSFDFVALDYTNPHKNTYAYRLEGLDPVWVDAGNRRFASYTNIPPGDYVFRVKGANSNGIWNDAGAAVNIRIAPPFWQTAWFRILAAAGLLGLIFSGYRIRIRQLRKRQLQLEALVAERTANLKKRTIELEAQKKLVESAKKTIEKQASRLLEMDRIKNRFFANISHEFRTPLTLILSPLNDLLTGSKVNGHTDTFKLMRRNANRLLRLINQLLDISKLETGEMPLNNTSGDITEFIKEISDTFIPSAAERQIDFSLNSSGPIYSHFDRDKIEKVIYNLLSNAFKFTPVGGKILVGIGLKPAPPAADLKHQVIEIRVSDSGAGIPENQLPHIFDRFYQGNGKSAVNQEGTGIGLALVRELVELHGGETLVESEVDKGSVFIVSLPLVKAARAVNSTSKTQSTNGSLNAEAQNGVPQAEIKNGRNPKSEIRNPKSDIVLLVEDNADVRQYLKKQLGNTYTIMEAENGRDGIEKARQQIPDLIISDIMMPEMDGYEFCRLMKNDQKTSHIPVIMLTAKSSENSKLSGLETGADAYLTKPFNLQELQIRIENLIAQRRKMRERFSKEFLLKPSDVFASSPDAEFIERLKNVIDNHMENPDLTIEKVSGLIDMSRKQLHRKLRALTNQSPSQFLRSMRLQRAKQLLEQQAGNVTEIAFNVGFSSSSYFTKCFREAFGILPSELEKQTSHNL